MEEEVSKLQKCLQEKDEQLRSSTSSTEQVKISLNPSFEFTQIFQLELSQPNMPLLAISWRYQHKLDIRSWSRFVFICFTLNLLMIS